MSPEGGLDESKQWFKGHLWPSVSPSRMVFSHVSWQCVQPLFQEKSSFFLPSFFLFFVDFELGENSEEGAASARNITKPLNEFTAAITLFCLALAVDDSEVRGSLEKHELYVTLSLV